MGLQRALDQETLYAAQTLAAQLEEGIWQHMSLDHSETSLLL